MKQPLISAPADNRHVALRFILCLSEQFAIALGDCIDELHEHTIVNRTVFLGHIQKYRNRCTQCGKRRWDIARLTDLDGIRKRVHGTKHALESVANRLAGGAAFCIVVKILLNRSGNTIGNECVRSRDQFIDINGAMHIKYAVLTRQCLEIRIDHFLDPHSVILQKLHDGCHHHGNIACPACNIRIDVTGMPFGESTGICLDAFGQRCDLTLDVLDQCILMIVE